MTTSPLPGPHEPTPATTRPTPTPRPAATGPYAPTVAAGLVGLLVAGFVLAVHATRLHVDLVRVAPWAMLCVGLLLLGAGALALARRPREEAADAAHDYSG